MKKLITICIAFALALSLIPAAFADWDLSGLTFDDLIALRAQIQHEMMSRGEWEEVEVPQGVYKVGKDIPAGTWTILCKNGYATNIRVGVNLNAAGTELEYPYKASEAVCNTSFDTYGGNSVYEWSVTLYDGDYVWVDFADAVFTTYAGKPSLGFKALS